MSVTRQSDTMIDRVVLGHYRVVRHLADGTTGAIYLARDESANVVRPAVIKWVLPSHSGDRRITDLLVREARIMGQLSHPNVVSVLGFAEEDGKYMMALEYVHGFTLDHWARHVRQVRGSFDVAIAVHVIGKVLDALDHAHNLAGEDGKPLGLVHRDVTPAHVLIDVQGRVKLADFGIAGIAMEKTSVGDVSLEAKFTYLPPESLDRAAASVVGDVYAVGLSLHEILAGHNELAGSTMSEIVRNVIAHVPTRLDKLRPDVPAALASVIERALAKSPAARYQTAGELARALAQAYPEDIAIAERFSRLTAEDFKDDRLVAIGSLPSLAEREAAWRPASTSVTSSAARNDVRQSSPPVPKRSRIGLAIVAGIVVLAALAAIVIATLAR